MKTFSFMMQNNSQRTQKKNHQRDKYLKKNLVAEKEVSRKTKRLRIFNISRSNRRTGQGKLEESYRSRKKSLEEYETL